MADTDEVKAAPRSRPRAVRLYEAVILAIIVGVGGYAAGVRNGIRIGERNAQSEAMPPGHPPMSGEADEAPGMAETPPAMPKMDMAAIRERLSGMDHGQLLDIGNQHLDEARMGGDTGAGPGSNMRFMIAVAAYERALELQPGSADVTTDLGIAYRGLQEPEKAVARFREAAKLDPHHPQSRFNLGLVLLHDLNRPAEAKAAWEDYLRVAPKGDQTRAMVEKELKQLSSAER
jgi:tetratricopeptide (TPR) repeat protein